VFLANRDPFTTALKTTLDAGLKDDDILEEAAEACADLLENQTYIYPESKHVLLKALAFCLVLLDKEGVEKKKEHLFKNKKSMDRFTKLIKVCCQWSLGEVFGIFVLLTHPFFPQATPVVPLFGDVSTTLESILKKAKHLEPGRFAYEADETVRRAYSILAALPEMRENYKGFVADYGVILNELNGVDPSNAQAKSLFNVLQRGALLASDLTRRILEQVCLLVLVSAFVGALGSPLSSVSRAPSSSTSPRTRTRTRSALKRPRTTRRW